MSVGGRADGRTVVDHEDAFLESGIAVHEVDHGAAVACSEIEELTVDEGYLRLNDLDASAITEVHLVQFAFRGVFESHAEWVVHGSIDGDTHGVGALDGAFDGDEHAGGIDLGDFVVDDQHVVGRDRQVVSDGEFRSVVGDVAVGGGDEVAHGIGRPVTWAGPLRLQR